MSEQSLIEFLDSVVTEDRSVTFVKKQLSPTEPPRMGVSVEHFDRVKTIKHSVVRIIGDRSMVKDEINLMVNQLESKLKEVQND